MFPYLVILSALLTLQQTRVAPLRRTSLLVVCLLALRGAERVAEDAAEAAGMAAEEAAARAQPPTPAEALQQGAGAKPVPGAQDVARLPPMLPAKPLPAPAAAQQPSEQGSNTTAAAAATTAQQTDTAASNGTAPGTLPAPMPANMWQSWAAQIMMLNTMMAQANTMLGAMQAQMPAMPTSEGYTHACAPPEAPPVTAAPIASPAETSQADVSNNANVPVATRAPEATAPPLTPGAGLPATVNLTVDDNSQGFYVPQDLDEQVICDSRRQMYVLALRHKRIIRACGHCLWRNGGGRRQWLCFHCGKNNFMGSTACRDCGAWKPVCAEVVPLDPDTLRPSVPLRWGSWADIHAGLIAGVPPAPKPPMQPSMQQPQQAPLGTTTASVVVSSSRSNRPRSPIRPPPTTA